jgi:hypothetical protein
VTPLGRAALEFLAEHGEEHDSVEPSTSDRDPD